jgi:hypothetical protein
MHYESVLGTDLVIFAWAFEALTSRVIGSAALACYVVILTVCILTLAVAICSSSKRRPVPGQRVEVSLGRQSNSWF